MGRFGAAIITVLLLAAAIGASRQTPTLVPPPVRDSDLSLTIEPVGKMPTPANATTPTTAGSSLLLIDQASAIYRWDGSTAQPLLLIKSVPSGIQPIGSEAILNAAANANGTVLFVVFTSSSTPRGITPRRSTRPGADAWQVLYRFDLGAGGLSNPRPIAALQVRTDGHTGGGLAVLADETVLFATGDNGDAGEDGRTWAQDLASHLGKILRIDSRDGSISVVAAGVRNPQQLSVGAREGEAYLDFVDMGGSLAEEFNSIALTDLLRDGAAINFGWGRNSKDGKAREGMLFIDGTGAAQGAAPANEPGFRSPWAHFGRENRKSFGVSGPVASDASFRRITALCGDLPGGELFALIGSRRNAGQPVFRVALVDREGKPVTLLQLSGSQRADPRFFNFPDGSAGVLLEKTGEFFRLTERSQASASSTVVRDGFFDSGGVTIHYAEQGAGPAVILLHEIDGGIRSWINAGVTTRLAASFRTIAIDMRAHGLSGKPHDPQQYGAEMARDVIRLMDKLGIAKAHIVGYSLGAEIALMLMASEPDRLLSVTLGAGVGRLRTRSTDAQHMEEEALEYLNFGVSPKLYLEEWPEGTPDPTLEQLRVLAATALADPSRDRQALAALSRARPARIVSPEKVAVTRMPVLAIAGSKDPELPELNALEKLRPGVTVSVIEGAMHSGPAQALDRPEFQDRLMAFLLNRKNIAETVNRPRNDVHANQLADFARGGRAGVRRSLY